MTNEQFQGPALAKLGQIDNRLDNIETGVTQLDKRMTGVEMRIGNVETKIDGHTERLLRFVRSAGCCP